MSILRGILKNWLPLAAAMTLLCGLVFVVAQQSLRMNANDPQIQMANDAAAALATGKDPASVVSATPVDLAKSAAPYLIVFDASGKPLRANAVLNDRVPNLPDGVIDYVRRRGEDRITWQPQPGVRSAVVIVPVRGPRGGFVLAGRSLRYTEQRIDQLQLLVGLGWLAIMAVTLGMVVFFQVIKL